MREPLTKFPTRPTGRHATLQTLAECRALLAKPRLSPEMREALQKKISDLTAELRSADAQKTKAADAG
jgi:hypothetical protein